MNHKETISTNSTIPQKFSYNKPIIHLTETDSTNKYAMQLLKDNPTDGTAIVADYQTGGKGQSQNSWHSDPAKNLLISVIWKNVVLKADENFYLTKAVTYAVHQFLKQCFNLDAMIKWPNDMVVNDKKIAGILIENTISGTSIKASVIGVGINVNQANFPADLPNATSAHLLNNQVYPIAVIQELFLGYLQQGYQLLKLKQHNRLTDFYLKHLYRLNEKHQFIVDKNKIEATIVGVDRWGKLIILHNSEFKSFNNKEIQFVY